MDVAAAFVTGGSIGPIAAATGIAAVLLVSGPSSTVLTVALAVNPLAVDTLSRRCSGGGATRRPVRFRRGGCADLAALIGGDPVAIPIVLC